LGAGEAVSRRHRAAQHGVSGRLARRLHRWDTIRPNDPVVEFGAAAWKYVPLGNDLYFAASDFRTRPALDRRLALFARAYGIHDRETVVWALHQAKLRSVDATRYFPLTPAQAAADLRRVADELEWLADSIVDLVAGLD
jgi:hypothetical protein